MMEKWKITSDEAFENAIQTGVTMVDFNAPWCAPCRFQEPIMKQLAGRYEGKALIVAMNIDEHGDLAQKLGIHGIPTLVLYKNGREIQRFVGLQPESTLIEALENTVEQMTTNNKEKIMSEEEKKETREEATTETHKPARPLKFFKDKQGNGWLCDKDIDPDVDFAAQGCWRCEDMAFPMGGR